MRLVARLLTLVILATASGAPVAAELAGRAVRFVVPYPAGGGADAIARVLAARIADALGGRIVVDNRVGASGIVGSEFVAKSPPDGATFMLVVASHGINAASGRKLPFDTERDFAPVMLVGWGPNVVTVHPSLPARSIRDLIALARTRRGEVQYASFGAGSVSHLSGELFAIMAKAEMVHVPYRGAAPAMIDVAGGQVPLAIGSLVASMTFVRDGRLRALAVTSPERSTLVPDLPTVAESGLPGYETREWWAVFAPAGVSGEAVGRLHRELKRALSHDEARQRLASVGAEVVGSEPAVLAAFLGKEIGRWRETIRAGRITIE
jgi:tripartite-type tricarboxylate transporter receptor subunit TctC